METRKIISFISFFLLPVTLNYFSPVLIVQAGFENAFTVMHIVYGLMLLSAMIFGAAWCGYVCPFGAAQDIIPGTGKSKSNQKKLPNLKVLTGVIWLGLILYPVIRYGFNKTIIFYHMEDTKVTLDSLHGLILYYMITGGIVLLCALIGKRVWCRYLCPMYIFNYLGIKLAKLLRIPGLKMVPNMDKCTQCRTCSSACLMALDVPKMVKDNNWNRSECIQCGECMNACKSDVLKRGWGK